MDLFVFFQLLLPGLTTGCVYALVALGFVLTANVSGVVNFAQGEFVMLGGIVAAALVRGWGISPGASSACGAGSSPPRLLRRACRCCRRSRSRRWSVPPWPPLRNGS